MSKINSIIKYLSVIGIVFSIYLVVRELLDKGYCPDFFGTPACWLVLLAYVLVFLSTLMKKGKSILFYPGALLGVILAVNFSARQLFSIEDCPQIVDVPLCYVSFIIFAVMILLFILQRKMGKRKKAAKDAEE
ncbi:hypothetical protein SAMN02745751_01191 [Dethiosulfatibacter aminovorans DSM 17477]|uniref:Uncharacterized protein n=1 Tax=Dethiosulfatibacter aminovorans DSM 17477 TaxID=1121476 RepID=A0A1M6EH15_9FIRM|nr:hypothetical protein [Dethiosulfatibacter aminovorans]SHI84610.1 hypothetical protein SAMN02745751_01191 [Dethiosulfatibacter aminovorans DSM 17477]